ncbi:hypothetical protein ACB098_05G103700 [Castanea mollissima]
MRFSNTLLIFLIATFSLVSLLMEERATCCPSTYGLNRHVFRVNLKQSLPH